MYQKRQKEDFKTKFLIEHGLNSKLKWSNQ